MRYLLCSFALLGAMSTAQAADVEGSADHPLIGRFAGAEIAKYKHFDFDEIALPQGKIASDADKQASTLKLEGRITAIEYLLPPSKTALEVVRNYQQSTATKGFQPLFECKGYEECGSNFSDLLKNGGLNELLPSIGDGGRMLLSKRQAPEGDVYLLLVVGSTYYKDHTQIFQAVVEVQPMEQGQIKVEESSELKKDLDATGRVAVYGVHFDTAKTDIKPESQATLEQMAKLLKDNPEWKVYIVGHTDNVGALDGNLDLSKRRAEAVVKALSGEFGIPAERLGAYGVASLAPAASNAEETGRALNRRVEIVLR